MGNYLSKPNVDKCSFDGSSAQYAYRWGVSDMQGWRTQMEDAYLIDFNISNEETVYLFGVYDGHGGGHIARYVANNMSAILGEQLKLQGNYERALKSSYLLLDERLWLDETSNELMAYAMGIKNRMSPGIQIKAPAVALNRSAGIPTEENSVEDLSHVMYKVKLSNVPSIEPTHGKLEGQSKPETYLTDVDRCRERDVCNVINRDRVMLNLLNEDQDLCQSSNSSLLPMEEEFEEEADSGIPSVKNNSFKDKTSTNVASSETTNSGDSLKGLKNKLSHYLPARFTRNNSKKCTSSTNKLQDKSERYTSDDSSSYEDDLEDEARGQGPWCSNNIVFAALESMKKLLGLNKCNRADATSMAMLTGCTAVTCLITNESYIVANAGDSRCVLCRGTKAMDLSTDHKPDTTEEQMRIYAAGGYLYMGRVNGNLNLTRALGDLLYKKNENLPPEKQIVSAYPDVTVTQRTDADEFLIMGCDGIWEMLSSQQVVNFVLERISDAINLSAIVEELFETLLSPSPDVFECGCDNMTAIIVDLKHDRRGAVREGS